MKEKNNKPATVDELSELHQVMAQQLKELIKDSPTASLLNVARQFLKDNGIECVGENDPEMRELEHSLPDFIGEDQFEG